MGKVFIYTSDSLCGGIILCDEYTRGFMEVLADGVDICV